MNNGSGTIRNAWGRSCSRLVFHSKESHVGATVEKNHKVNFGNLNLLHISYYIEIVFVIIYSKTC